MRAFVGDSMRGLAVSTPWSLGKEKHSRIDARIFPNPSGSSSFPIEHQRKTHAECVRSLVTLSGLEPEFAP